MSKESKCFQCKKEFPPKDLIYFWDNEGDWHYCNGHWRSHRRNFGRWGWLWNLKKKYPNCCRDFSNYPLFLCRPCYYSYQERKKQTIQQNKKEGRIIITVAVPILTAGLVLTLFCLFKNRKKRK